MFRAALTIVSFAAARANPVSHSERAHSFQITVGDTPRAIAISTRGATLETVQAVCRTSARLPLALNGGGSRREALR
jgi:hypothetical protein